jgi:hypothetical protein
VIDTSLSSLLLNRQTAHNFASTSSHLAKEDLRRHVNEIGLWVFDCYYRIFQGRSLWPY